jgi:hypothetical protein
VDVEARLAEGQRKKNLYPALVVFICQPFVLVHPLSKVLFGIPHSWSLVIVIECEGDVQVCVCVCRLAACS